MLYATLPAAKCIRRRCFWCSLVGPLERGDGADQHQAMPGSRFGASSFGGRAHLKKTKSKVTCTKSHFNFYVFIKTYFL